MRITVVVLAALGFGSLSQAQQFAENVRVGTLSTSCQVSVTAVRMFDSHTLQVDVTGQFSSDPNSSKSLSAATNIGGASLSSTFALLSGSTGTQAQSLFLDLSVNNVARFTDNARFFITPGLTEGAAACTSSPQIAAVLLPVVIIPGIFNGSGGDGTYPTLEATLKAVSLGPNVLGAPYELRSDPTGYPTLYTLSYATTTSTFLAGASQLDLLINQVKSLTWADKVNVVTHSKGGLVARQYLVSFASGPTNLNQLIMAVPPNSGSVWATFAGLRNMYPVWKWVRAAATDPFVFTPNSELADLNARPLPNNVKYAIFYSVMQATAFTRTGTSSPFQLGRILGDGIVPGFSMLGWIIDPNNLASPPVLIPAFRSLNISKTSIPGLHAGYLQLPDVMTALVQRLTQ
jgi:hypothetical protein